MSEQEKIIFGIDLGTTYSCIAYVDEYGKPVIIPNTEGFRTTPSVVQFDGTERVVGKVAKESAVLYAGQVVELIKRHMGEANWRFPYNGVDYTPEEISSYILRKLALDAEQQLGHSVTDVVITCPAYFGVAQREATKKAGEIAGFKVWEIINEPTAAAIMYGLQEERDQVVLIYDLGGGTFDITVIEIKGNAIRVVATGGDHNLGGRNWDESVVLYLADKWMEETGSTDTPTDSKETLQDLWMKAESAKWTLSQRQETTVPVSHAGQRVGVKLTREKFDELTDKWLEQTIMFTRATMEEARKRGYHTFDQILLVGGSTRMPQVKARLEKEFNLPLKIFDPDEAVAKGAAVYGHKLLIDQKIQYEVAKELHALPEEIEVAEAPTAAVKRAQEKVALESGMKLSAVQNYSEISVTNVSSHSFGVIVWERDPATRREREVISNLIRVNDPVPASPMKTFGTYEANQDAVELKIVESTLSEETVEDLTAGEQLGEALLPLPMKLPAGSPIEVAFELNREGRLHIAGRDPRSGSVIEATFQTKHVASEEEIQAAKGRRVVIS